MNGNPVYVPNNDEIQKFQIFMHKNTGKYCYKQKTCLWG